MSLLFNILFRLVITFLPRSNCFLISWLQSQSVVILEPPKIKSATFSTVFPSQYLNKFIITPFPLLLDFHSYYINLPSLFSHGQAKESCILCFVSNAIYTTQFSIHFLLVSAFSSSSKISLPMIHLLFIAPNGMILVINGGPLKMFLQQKSGLSWANWYF